MKRFKRMLAMGLAAMMSMSAMSVCVLAADNEQDVIVPESTVETFGEEFDYATMKVITIEGEPGDILDLGNGLRCEIISNDGTTRETDSVMSSRASSESLWNTSSLFSENIYYGSYYYIKKYFALNSTYRYFQLYFGNTQDTSETYITFYNSDDDTLAVDTQYKIPCGCEIYIYTQEKWPIGSYYAKFTSNSIAIQGKSYAYRATTLSAVTP